jgi:hypothetical protein
VCIQPQRGCLLPSSEEEYQSEKQIAECVTTLCREAAKRSEFWLLEHPETLEHLSHPSVHPKAPETVLAAGFSKEVIDAADKKLFLPLIRQGVPREVTRWFADKQWKPWFL